MTGKKVTNIGLLLVLVFCAAVSLKTKFEKHKILHDPELSESRKIRNLNNLLNSRGEFPAAL